MTPQEAEDKAFTVRWKTSTCSQGEECWCRIIEPEEKIEFNEVESYYIAGSGCIGKREAEHIVKLHNESLLKK